MPLIIDPSSCCDVCLEPLTYDDPKPPHAIPCGHIFCRECLILMHPKICPLCRKSYQTDRVKKLITGEGEEPAQREGRRLLLKLVMLWDGDPLGELSEVTREVEQWLNAGNAYEPLGKAQHFILHYHVMGMDNTETHRAIRRLKRELQQREIEQMNERDSALATEHTLKSQVQELMEKISIYEGQIASLRQELDSFKLSKNPLPPPPKPYPYALDQLPQFSEPNGSSSSYQWANSPTNGNSGPYTNGQAIYFDPDVYTAVSPYIPPVDVTGRRRDPLARRGKYDIYGPPGPDKLPPTTSPVIDVNGLKNAIIPGASPGKRFVPKSVFEDVPPPLPPSPVQRIGLGLHMDGGDGVLGPPRPIDTYGLMADYVTEYANGYQDGYTVAQRAPPVAVVQPQPQPRARSSRTEAAPVPPPPPPPARTTVRSPLLEPPPQPRPQTASVSQMEIPRWFGELGITLPARSTTSAQQAPSPHSAPAQQQSSMHTTGTYRPDDSRRATSRQQPLSPSSVSVNGTPQNSASASNARHRPHTSASTPMSSQIYASPLAFPIQEAQEEHRPRSERRQTIQPDGYLAETESSRRASGEISTARPSGLRRRSAVASRRSSEVTEAPTQAPTSAPPQEQRQSVASSSGSWGTVNTNNPAAPEDQPIRDSAHFYNGSIGSVRDLQLRSFDDFSEPASRASLDAGSMRMPSIDEDLNMAFLPANPPVQRNSQQNSQQQHQSQQQQDAGREREREREREQERGDITPRIRPVSLSESSIAPSIRTISANSQATERPQGRRQASYPVIPSTAPIYHNDYTTTTTTNTTTTVTQEPPAPAPSRSSRAHRHNRDRARVSSSQATHGQWSDPSYVLEPPAGGNALGLTDITVVPEMAAPTPVVSSHNFLRSFSYD